jgi:glycosyltransferase involved in cell wall biosynthesis
MSGGDNFLGLKVVLVHDWLTGMRGGEKVLECFCRLFPQAPLYTLLHIPGSVSSLIEDRRIVPSFIQKMPQKEKRYRYFLPLFPLAAERLKLPPCDLVLSSSHCVAKNVRVPPGALHLSYLHTPMRYVWDMYGSYFGPQSKGPGKLVMPFFRSYLQRQDVRTAQRVDHFLANSHHVALRIQRHYGRRAQVVHPPVELSRFNPSQEVEDYYLVLSALVPYKRVDLAIEAATRLGRRLKVVGKGPELENLKAMAGPGVEFLGWQPDEALPELYAKARAFIFPGEEDFGITPLESMASGRPVIAFGKGGALETVVGRDDPDARPATGVFFPRQDADSLVQAIEGFERMESAFDPKALAAHARSFDTPVFIKKIQDIITEHLPKAAALTRGRAGDRL